MVVTWDSLIICRHRRQSLHPSASRTSGKRLSHPACVIYVAPHILTVYAMCTERNYIQTGSSARESCGFVSHSVRRTRLCRYVQRLSAVDVPSVELREVTNAAYETSETPHSILVHFFISYEQPLRSPVV